MGSACSNAECDGFERPPSPPAVERNIGSTQNTNIHIVLADTAQRRRLTANPLLRVVTDVPSTSSSDALISQAAADAAAALPSSERTQLSTTCSTVADSELTLDAQQDRPTEAPCMFTNAPRSVISTSRRRSDHVKLVSAGCSSLTVQGNHRVHAALQCSDETLDGFFVPTPSHSRGSPSHSRGCTIPRPVVCTRSSNSLKSDSRNPRSAASSAWGSGGDACLGDGEELFSLPTFSIAAASCV